jgi:hypothetical protein
LSRIEPHAAPPALLLLAALPEVPGTLEAPSAQTHSQTTEGRTYREKGFGAYVSVYAEPFNLRNPELEPEPEPEPRRYFAARNVIR